MRAIAAILVLGLPLVCAAGTSRYPIDVEQELNGLDIVVTATPGAFAILTLQNRSRTGADCRAEFEGGLATPARKATRVAAGKTATMSYTVKDDLARLRVKLTCSPTPADK